MNLKKLFQGLLVVLLAVTLIFSSGIGSASADDLLPEGSFPVKATNEAGVSKTNGGFGSLEYTFNPFGKWTYRSGQPELDSCGDPSWSGQDKMTYPKFTSFSLIADCGEGNVHEICGSTTIEIGANVTCKFKMNDVPGTYYDNEGTIDVGYND
ncbi:MAG: hypothetical protein F6K41_04375 [Symploca sp. SIO3E6]|nr:hypothetical protein [Caldora sp. SIO3E6]